MVSFLLKHLLGCNLEVSVEVPNRGDTSAADKEKSPSELLEMFHRVFHQPPSGKVTLLLANHHTRIDWMLLWMLFYRVYGAPATLRIALKASMSQFPFFGWAMQYFRFIFMARSWEEDQKTLPKITELWRLGNESVMLLIFPEGTDLSEKNIQRNHEYAGAQGLPRYYQVLHPRTKGVDAIRELLKKTNSLYHIIDCTMAYTEFAEGERPSDIGMLKGRMPPCTHVLLRSFEVNGGGSEPSGSRFVLPADITNERLAGGKFAGWIQQLFADKEELLTDTLQVAAKRRSSGKKDEASVGNKGYWQPSSKRMELSTIYSVPLSIDQSPGIWQGIVIPVWWFAFITLTLYLVFVQRGFWLWSSILLIIWHVVLTKVFGGHDRWLYHPLADGNGRSQ